MSLDETEIGQAYLVIDVPQSEICMCCVPCTRFRLMEIGFGPGEIVMPVMRQLGILAVKLEGSSSHIALREDEARRVIVKKL